MLRQLAALLCNFAAWKAAGYQLRVAAADRLCRHATAYSF
jgi:hypothetical protein